jgi:hypothetical protein
MVFFCLLDWVGIKFFLKNNSFFCQDNDNKAISFLKKKV